jgi:uncharacterized protein YggE
MMGERTMKRCQMLLVATVVLFGGLDSGAVHAQGFGGGGSLSGGHSSDQGGHWIPKMESPLLEPQFALNYITIDGTAELRVEPEGIRLVLAITSEAETADRCQELNADQVQAVIGAWSDLNVPEDHIVEDFINLLPIYEWRLAERDGTQFRVQQRSGFRMQSNLHLAVESEADAMAAINRAFQQGVTEIVTLDYWSSDLDERKKEARAAAVAAAKEKAETLLSVFDAPPRVINIQESTTVFSPQSLYRTYENVLEEEVQYPGSLRDRPTIRAYRPKMTFFHGLQSRSDRRPPGPAMRPEIAVVSTVRIYYESPADKTYPAKRGD